jgi:hypothetical protein
MLNWRGFFIGAMVLLCSAPAAHAQFLVRYSEGPGLKLTDNLVFHPGIGVTTTYDSNVFFNASSENPVSAPTVAAVFHLGLATLPPQRTEDQPTNVPGQVVDFRLSFSGAYRTYLSDLDTVSSQSNMDLDGSLNALFNPRGQVQLRITDDFVRMVTPKNIQSEGSFVRDHNEAAAVATFAPGGGMLSFGVGYRFILDHFENDWDNGVASFDPDLTIHQLSLNAKWQFLPKTAALLNVTEGITRRGLVLTAGGSRHPDSYPLRVELGLVGQLTFKLQATLTVGYANAFYQDVANRTVGNYNNVIGSARLRWQIDSLAWLSLGYDLNFADSLFADLYTDHHAFARYDHMLFGRLVLHLEGGYRYRTYSGIDPFWGLTARNDNLFEVHAGADFRIREWLFVGVAYDLLADRTDARPAFGAGLPDDPSYTRQVVSFLLSVAY